VKYGRSHSKKINLVCITIPHSFKLYKTIYVTEHIYYVKYKYLLKNNQKLKNELEHALLISINYIKALNLS